MSRRLAVAVMAAVALGAAPAAASAAPVFSPGAPGIGDAYFPFEGNGGYDARHYTLDVAYEPATDRLTGVATMSATATQDLSRFDLDFTGLTVRSIRVDGRAASWTRAGQELVITPAKGLRKGANFTVVTAYDGVPQTIGDSSIGVSGFLHTDDGALVAGQPDVAATWFPVNDHPRDKARYTLHITVPEGLQAIANGLPRGSRTRAGKTTFDWEAREPMASYLVTMAIGHFDVQSYRRNGRRFVDAVDSELDVPAVPRTGRAFAISQRTSTDVAGYKRLERTITVPAGGAQLSFWVRRSTEPEWDHFFVEAHAVGSGAWTTLRDLNGHNTQSTGASCPSWLGLHPFLAHYETDNGDGTCAPTGSTGEWWAKSGVSAGYEQWKVDLSAYAGRQVEVSLSYASDDLFQLPGVEVDDIVVSTGEGSTSFEPDGDVMDGWTVPGAPEGSPSNENDWIAGGAADAPAPLGVLVRSTFAKQPRILQFLSRVFGPYPLSAAGGIADIADITFALETQTRPVYALGFFTDEATADAVVVHEDAHQWTGDYLSLHDWQHIWLNEGFATYAEWLWSEQEGLGTAQEQFDARAAGIPADDAFWSLTIGDPGADALFEAPVYDRGAMTLHALRVRVGDRRFFRIMRLWVRSQAGGTVTTDEFIRLAERVTGEDLDGLFRTWLFTPSKPAGIEPAAAAGRSAAAGLTRSASPLGRTPKR